MVAIIEIIHLVIFKDISIIIFQEWDDEILSVRIKTLLNNINQNDFGERKFEIWIIIIRWNKKWYKSLWRHIQGQLSSPNLESNLDSKDEKCCDKIINVENIKYQTRRRWNQCNTCKLLLD